MDSELYRTMLRIRVFEENLLNFFSQGKLSGTTHTYIGQEAIAVAALRQLHIGDAVFSNHRCHGHFIAYGGKEEILLAEIMGMDSGVCAGKGGSQHLCYKKFFSNGIQGGMVPIAAGYALSNKLSNQDNISVAFIGDGTLGEGIVYEALNMLSLYDIPMLLIVEDNGYAQSTPKSKNLAGTIEKRFAAFDIAAYSIRSNDIHELSLFFEKAFDTIRSRKKPVACIVQTYRLSAHSKGDDYRDKAEIESWRKQDPLVINESYFERSEIERIQQQVREESDNIFKSAENQTPVYGDASSGIYYLQNHAGVKIDIKAKERFSEQLNNALDHILGRNQKAVLFGEDILDPYGGAFKVTKGLSTKYKERVFSTPISEAGMMGFANGMALNGYKPIVEVMFGDFATLMLDQILNHAAKFSYMYNDQIQAPILLRMPVGGKRGYGPTHSQCLERIFMGYPNITVIAPTIYHNAGAMLEQVYNDMMAPTIFVEYKGFYAQSMWSMPDEMDFEVESDNRVYDTLLFYIEKENVDATIVCYGEAIEEAIRAAWELMLEDELNVQVVCPSYIYPIPVKEVYHMISGEAKEILVIDNSYKNMGWDRCSGNGRQVDIVSADDVYIPASKELEKEVLSSAGKLKEKLLKEL